METQNVKDTVRQIFTEYLTANGHRKTPERYAILETIYSIDGHFDIDMLYSRMMDQENFRVSRATLYNTIILLINARLIIKHQFGTSSQYEKSYNRETHHHQICTQCGKVTEFQNEELQHAIENTKLSRFQLSHYSLYIYGVCSKCTWAKRKKKNLDMIAANNLKQQGAGFAGDTNVLTLITEDWEKELALMSKDEAAKCLLDELLKIKKNKK